MRERLHQNRAPAEFGPIIDMLEGELDRAEVVGNSDLPADVVTMDSTVVIQDMDSGENLEYTVTWPEKADPANRKLSILAPVGMALLGYQVGQIVEWPVPSGKRRFRLEKVLYQPEASGQAED